MELNVSQSQGKAYKRLGTSDDLVKASTQKSKPQKTFRLGKKRGSYLPEPETASSVRNSYSFEEAPVDGLNGFNKRKNEIKTLKKELSQISEVRPFFSFLFLTFLFKKSSKIYLIG